MVLHHRGCPIRKSAGHRLLPPYRSLSQVITSFIGSQCQGIHLTLFFAWTAFAYSLLNKFSFFCLSFANNCFLGCKLKRPFGFIIHFLVLSALDYSSNADEIVPTFTCTEKPLKFCSNKFFSKLTLLYKLTVLQLSVSFLLLFGFQWAFTELNFNLS